MEDFLCIFKIGHLLYRCAAHLGVAHSALMCSLSGRCGNLQNSTQTRSPISVFGEAFKVRTAEHGEQVVIPQTQYCSDISEQSFTPRIIFSLMWQKYLKHIQTHTHLTTKGRMLSRSFTYCHLCSMKRKYVFQKFRPERHCTLTFRMFNLRNHLKKF